MNRGQPVSLRIPQEAREVILEAARSTGRDFSSVANEMLMEAARMRRIPGIVFAEGPTGRRARIAGTGVDEVEVVREVREGEQRLASVRDPLAWTAASQL